MAAIALSGARSAQAPAIINFFKVDLICMFSFPFCVDFPCLPAASTATGVGSSTTQHYRKVILDAAIIFSNQRPIPMRSQAARSLMPLSEPSL